MAQDVANDLQIGSRIDLPAGMCVPESMRTNHSRCDSGLVCIFSNPVSDAGTSQRLVRYSCVQEYLSSVDEAGAFILQISG
jgi:hypothetical protein